MYVGICVYIIARMNTVLYSIARMNTVLYSIARIITVVQYSTTVIIFTVRYDHSTTVSTIVIMITVQ